MKLVMCLVLSVLSFSSAFAKESRATGTGSLVISKEAATDDTESSVSYSVELKGAAANALYKRLDVTDTTNDDEGEPTEINKSSAGTTWGCTKVIKTGVITCSQDVTLNTQVDDDKTKEKPASEQ